MLGKKKSAEQPMAKNARRSIRAMEQSPEEVLNEAVDAVHRLLQNGNIDQKVARVILSILYTGYLSYTINQEADELLNYVMESVASYQGQEWTKNVK